MFYFKKTPKLLKWLFPKRVWRFSNSKKKLYLTFDDGPIPQVTPWVLDLLQKYQAKATFFCIGHNVLKHPQVYKQLIKQGHSIGNHSHNHLNGWKTKTSFYIDNVQKAQKAIGLSKTLKKPLLFRPPYGRLKIKQSKTLLQKGYKIIMWDVLSADFDFRISNETCLQNVLKHAKNGSIIVFHDSLKSEEKIRYALPKVLEHFTKNGFEFCAI